MQQYQFEKIFSQMEKEFGKIQRGDEDFHTMMIYPIESNLLKTYRRYPASNTRRLLEAIALVLFDIRSKYTGESFDLSNFRNEDNARLEHAILMAFDHFTNEELRSQIADRYDLTDAKTLHDFYEEPVICLLRIKESVDDWIRRMGSNGYFEFAEQYIGPNVIGDQMTYSYLEDADE